MTQRFNLHLKEPHLVASGRISVIFKFQMGKMKSLSAVITSKDKACHNLILGLATNVS